MSGVAAEERRLVNFVSRAEFRAWLAAHHAGEREAWVIIQKKGSRQQGVRYEEAVEEALCFGWIDGQTRALDADRFAQRFSPRRRGSTWAESNRERVLRLTAEGKMTPAGIAVLPDDLRARVQQAMGNRQDG